MSHIDKLSPTWRAVDAWAEGQLRKARASLETPGLDHATTEALRSSIKTLKELQALARPEKQISASTVDYAA